MSSYEKSAWHSARTERYTTVVSVPTVQNTITRYVNRERGEKAQMLRSLMAAQRCEFSQRELRYVAAGFVGGEPDALQNAFPFAPVLAQWSAGYRCDMVTREMIS